MSSSLSVHLRHSLDNEFAEDWARQRRTAQDILNRLESREGAILADQVGMGKTFVALAVAVTQILRTRTPGQVVVFAPSRVARKWIGEWGKFQESLLKEAPPLRCVAQPINSGEAFLKALDDPPERRNHLLIVTHEALTHRIKDSFIQLALLYYAIKHKHDAAGHRSIIARWSNGAKGLIDERRFTPERVLHLLGTPPQTWRDVWEKLTDEMLDDDPVPVQLDTVAQHVDLYAIRTAIQELPERTSSNIEARLKHARSQLSNAMQQVWKQLLARAKLHLPLLIVDEAHALKNDGTRISRMFTPRPDEPGDGAFTAVFDRILMLTATPFELEHNELIGVLSRLAAVRPLRPKPETPLHDQLDQLTSALKTAQETSIALSTSWQRIVAEDWPAFDAWAPDSQPPDTLGADARRAWRDACLAVSATKRMNAQLRPWIIRHQRPHRRDYFCGAAIVPGQEARTTCGLDIPDHACLPFLLAARAQAIAAEDHTGAARPLFAYGIVSSFDAFLRLDAGAANRDSDVDENSAQDTAIPIGQATGVHWYRREIAEILGAPEKRMAHPKIAATVERVVQLWLSGQKCLVFCWFIRTTKALEDAISERLNTLIISNAGRALSVSDNEVNGELDRLSNRLLKSDSGNHERIRVFLHEKFHAATSGDDGLADALTRIAIRNLRTPASLLRYTHLKPDMDVDDLLRGISGENTAQAAVLSRWCGFAGRMATMTHDERARILAALEGHHTEDEPGHGRGASLAPVRRAYGGTGQDVRERLIGLFNTPFAPDVLVASSVMGEGIDLHRECRHVIHHDLDWNPSKLEQRTGRLDRIGALAERIGAKIEVFEPFLAGTHDEKMFRVVTDRASWFDIVMGSSSDADESATDKAESRLPLHGRIRSALLMDLSST